MCSYTRRPASGVPGRPTLLVEPLEARLLLSADLTWSTFLGGDAQDWARDAATNAAGDVYVTGYTTSGSFPTENGYDLEPNGGEDAFLSKFGSDGSLLWSTYLGGSGYDRGYALATDGAGNVYVCGWTESADFPVPNGWDTTHGGGSYDAFLAKFSPVGSILWSTFLGGGGSDYAYGIVVGGPDVVYVTGETGSPDFPVPGGYDQTYDAQQMGFVARFDASGALVWGTFHGGGGYDRGNELAVDDSGNVYLGGTTESWDFPTTDGSLYDGPRDGFLSGFSASGSLLWSTLVGGSMGDQVDGVCLLDGSLYIFGETDSPDFPASGSYDSTLNGQCDAYVARFDLAGTRVWSSFLGGWSGDSGCDIAASGQSICVVGNTSSDDFPVADAIDDTHNGKCDAFATSFSLDGDLVWSTFLGGSEEDRAYGVAAAGGCLYIVGRTDSVGFPVLDGYDLTHNGSYDAFVARLGTPEPVGSWSSGEATVSVWDVEGAVDVDPADVRVQFAPDGSVKAVRLRGSAPMTGVGIVVSGTSEAVRIVDQRHGAVGDVAFIAADCPIRSIRLRSGISGYNLNGSSVGGIDFADDIDGDGETGDLTAIYCVGSLGTVRVEGQINGDIWVGEPVYTARGLRSGLPSGGTPRGRMQAPEPPGWANGAGLSGPGVGHFTVGSPLWHRSLPPWSRRGSLTA